MITVGPMLRLRQIRERKEVSLRALAKLAGVGVATLARMEAGKWDPRLSTLKKLARTLDVTVAELIGEKSLKKGG
jgi:XRE family transcriptional regulator, regulator of sulfur utilization